MFKYFYLIFIILSGELYAKVEFSSPFVNKTSFSIKEGKVYSKSVSSPLSLVQNQLKYMFGILNELDSGIDFPNLKVVIINQKNINGLIETNYKASGIIAWDSKNEIPHIFKMLLPKRGDDEGLIDFLNKYQKNCAKKPASLGSFWNYYRPHHEGCPLKDAVTDDVIELSARLKDKVNHEDKREPNYRQIFEDNILEITSIITKDNPVDLQDISISDFRNLCGFFAKYAISITQSSNECHTESLINGQVVKAHLFLIDNFGTQPDLFLQKLSPHLLASDVVTYNGHSGMGINIESWLKFYPIKKDKYQIIFLNSCDTFGYFRNDIFDKIKNINKTSSSSDYVDVILNATPNFFGTFTNTNKFIINSLLSNSNFTELLRSLPTEQHSLLVFER